MFVAPTLAGVPVDFVETMESYASTWRRSVLGALHKAGRWHRVAYTSASLTGTYAPVMARLAVTVSNVTWVPEGLRLLPSGELPALPDSGIFLLKARHPAQPVTVPR